MGEESFRANSAGGLSATHPAEAEPLVRVAPTTGDQFNTVRFAVLPIACWRVDDIRFAFDSSVPQPQIADELGELADLIEEHPDSPLSIFGHADPAGKDDYNKVLSGRRAAAIYGLLRREPALWEEIYSRPHGNDDWRKGALETMLAEVSGSTGEDPRAYRQDESRRRELFAAYMEKLCAERLQPLSAARFLGGGADPGGKAALQGCGEFNPLLIFSREEHQKYEKAADKTERNLANAPNRRVLILLFRKGTKVDPARWPCPRWTEGIAGCKKRFWSDADARRNTRLPSDRREYKATRDTFACRFYDRMVNHSPCEQLVKWAYPVFYTIEQPGAANYVRLHALWAYLVYYRGDSARIAAAERFAMRDGQLWDTQADAPRPIQCDRPFWVYFSHRDDLLELEREKWFARDRSGLPLLGPFRVPVGPDPKVELDIWQQNDWAIVRGPFVDGTRPGKPKMCQWRDDYKIGQLLPLASGEVGFIPHGDQRHKMSQERWRGGKPLDLAHLGNPGGNPLWAGTLSALPSAKAKILLVHHGPGGELFVGSYNEIAPTGRNQEWPGHHQYREALVKLLLALPASRQPAASVDALPQPPARWLIPGDMCWQDQGQTNHCGAYSFSTAMNYWFPYTNNPDGKNGAFYARPGNVDDTVNGARTPRDIVNAARKFRMNGRDNDAEGLDKARGLKLLKLWLWAGVPVLILVKEEYNLWSYHWKTVVGYEGSRFFLNNSGADLEAVRAHRTPGIDYERAPVGNDVDSESAFWDKWKAAGGDIVDAFTSVDECTFIPLYPTDAVFAGKEAR